MGISFNSAPSFGSAGPGFSQGVKFTKPTNPLDSVDYSGDLAADAAAELTAMEQAYRDRASAEADRFRSSTDSEFWFAVCFKSRAEKESFLAEFAPNLGDKYVDGTQLARSLRQ